MLKHSSKAHWAELQIIDQIGRRMCQRKREDVRYKFYEEFSQKKNTVYIYLYSIYKFIAHKQLAVQNSIITHVFHTLDVFYRWCNSTLIDFLKKYIWTSLDSLICCQLYFSEKNQLFFLQRTWCNLTMPMMLLDQVTQPKMKTTATKDLPMTLGKLVIRNLVTLLRYKVLRGPDI